MGKRILAIAILSISLLALLASLRTTQAQTPNVTIVLYANEFGFSFSTPTVPLSGGPTLDFSLGDTVNVTVINDGTTQHSWELVASYPGNMTVLFNAAIAPINPGESGNVTFVVTETGAFSYLCYIDDHPALGMVGSVAIVIPEFSTAALLASFMALTLAIAVAKAKTRKSLAKP